MCFVADGTERQTIQDMDGKMPRPKIRSCSISDPFVLIIREDDSLGLFIGEPDRGKIRRKDMSPMGDKVCRTFHLWSPHTNTLLRRPNILQDVSTLTSQGYSSSTITTQRPQVMQQRPCRLW